jgi:ribonuclease P protein component
MVVDPSLDGPRVAFAIGRQSGIAVERNRARRRCREALRSTTLPPGLYMFGLTRPAHEVSFARLRTSVADLQARISL